MITLLAFILMISVLGGFINLAVRFAWGLTKVVFCIIFLPVFCIGLFACGLVYLALPILIIAGIIGIICTIA